NRRCRYGWPIPLAVVARRKEGEMQHSRSRAVCAPRCGCTQSGHDEPSLTPLCAAVTNCPFDYRAAEANTHVPFVILEASPGFEPGVEFCRFRTSPHGRSALVCASCRRTARRRTVTNTSFSPPGMKGMRERTDHRLHAEHGSSAATL